MEAIYKEIRSHNRDDTIIASDPKKLRRSGRRYQRDLKIDTPIIDPVNSKFSIDFVIVCWLCFSCKLDPIYFLVFRVRLLLLSNGLCNRCIYTSIPLLCVIDYSSNSARVKVVV